MRSVLTQKLVHIVFFRLPESGPLSAEDVAAKLRTLEGNVPTLESLEIGIDVARSDRAWDVILHAVFADQQALDAYRVHPFHKDVLAWLVAHNMTTAVVDYFR